MFRNLAVLLICLLLITPSVDAQDSEPANVRVVQLSFVREGSFTIDVDIDNTLVFEDLSFPFSTPYISLSPGEHILTTSLLETDLTDSTTLSLEEGHQYTVIVQGDYGQDAVQYMLVDETDLPVDETGSVAIVANLTTTSIDFLVDEENMIEALEAGSYAIISLPEDAETYTTAPIDDPDIDTVTGDLDNLSNITLITVALRSDNGQIQNIQHHSSTLTIAEHMLSFENAAPFADAITTMTTQAAQSSEDGTFTAFIPTEDALIESLATLPTDLAEQEVWVANHITLANLAPYQLRANGSLTMLSGNTVSLVFQDTESGYWEIEGAPIWWDIRLTDGVIYIIDGLLYGGDE